MRTKSRLKIILPILAIVLLLIFRLWTFVHSTTNRHDHHDHVEMVDKTQKGGGRSYKDVALETLEDTSSKMGKAEQEQVIKALTKAYAYVSEVKLPEDAVASQENQLFLSKDSMVQTMVLVHLLGYRFDESSVEVYPSKMPNVYQFVYQAKAEGVEPLNYSGNFAVNTRQLEIVHQIGAIEKVGDAHDEGGHWHSHSH